MDAIDRLVAAEGTYLGRGRDRHDRDFRGELDIRREVDGAGVSLSFSALAPDDATLHQQEMLVGNTREGTPYLWGLDSATEQIRQYSLREHHERDGGEYLRFGSGDPADERHYREHITLAFDGDDLAFEIERGAEGEPFRTLCSAELVPSEFYSLHEESETAQIAYREYVSRPGDEIEARIERTAERIYGSDRWLDFEDDRFWNGDREVHLVVAEVEEAVIGFEFARDDGERRLRCWRGGTVPEYRGASVPSELIVRQLRWASRHHYVAVTVELPDDANDRLVDYLEEGFRVAGTYRSTGRRPRVVLEHGLDGDEA